MTAAARRVLRDCQVALDMLDEEDDGERWRVLWAGAVALLRAVGHVLQKVDTEGTVAKEVVAAAYSRWKEERSENRIFWDFIDQERNNILKEYQSSVADSAEVSLVIANPATGRSSHKSDEMLSILDENMFRPITDGFGEGEDARDVYRDAVAWWDAELRRIEAKISP